MVIRQGDIFWFDYGEPAGSEAGYRRPAVVVQNNLFNDSRIRTTVICPLTSNLKFASAPGNVFLEQKEAGLPTSSAVVVSQILTVNKRELVERIGTLSPRRVREILNGLRLLTEPREAD